MTSTPRLSFTWQEPSNLYHLLPQCNTQAPHNPPLKHNHSPSYNPHTSPSDLDHHPITAPIMDFIKNAMGNNDNDQREPNQQNRTNEPPAQKSGGGGGGGFLGGFGDKLNSAAGGGRESEKNEDYLDKGNSAPFPRTRSTYTRAIPYLPHTYTHNTHTLTQES